MNGSTVVRILIFVLVGACGSRAPSPVGASRLQEPDGAAPGGPNDHRTWTEKLYDATLAERAVEELERLGDPAVIVAIGDAWKAEHRPVFMLEAIIRLSRSGNWKLSMPFLVDALTSVDVASSGSLASALKAAGALGEAQDPAGVAALAGISQMPPSKKLIIVQVAAIRALGTFQNEKARAGAALVALIDREPPQDPRSATSFAESRALDEPFALFLAITGASINAVGALGDGSAAKSLVLSMYRTPQLFTQIRRALVASGSAAKNELREVLRGTSAAVNQLFTSKRLDRYCGERHDAARCQPVSARDFYAATVLGDFYDPAATPDLLAALARPTLPAYYADGQPGPFTQRDAIFDALRKLGSPDAAGPVRAIWSSRKGSLDSRTAAIGVYPYLARDNTGLDQLQTIALDNRADGMVQQEAATAFALMSSSVKAIEVLQRLADKSFQIAADRKKQADGAPKREADAANQALDIEKKILEKAKSDLIAITKDKSKTADEIMVAIEAVRAMERDFDAATNKHRMVIARYVLLDSRMRVERARARMFQTLIARVEIAIRCQQDLACYANSLTLTPEAAAKNLAPYIQDIGEWTAIEKQYLVDANIERAMLELGKRGTQASQLTDALLAAVKSENQGLRQSILLALPKIAKIPCESCVIQLEAAIKAGEGDITLRDLTLETTMVRNYFSSAGRAP